MKWFQMNRFHVAALVAPMLLLMAAGCSNDNDKSLGVSTVGATLAGQALVTPDLTGSWRADTTITVNSCGSLGASLTDDLILAFVSAGEAFDFDLFNLCGTQIGEGTGEINTSSVFTATSSRTLSLTADCTVDLLQTLNGTVNEDGDLITGAGVLTVTEDAASSGSCVGIPCRIDSTFLASFCPPADCSFLTCP